MLRLRITWPFPQHQLHTLFELAGLPSPEPPMLRWDGDQLECSGSWSESDCQRLQLAAGGLGASIASIEAEPREATWSTRLKRLMDQTDLHSDAPLSPRWRLLEKLSGGYSNYNYLVEVGDRRCVFRLCEERSEMLGIDRHQELQILRLVDQEKLGATLHRFDTSSGDLLTGFLEGVSEGDLLQRDQAAALGETTANSSLMKSAATKSKSERLFVIAKLLRKTHQLRPQAGVFDPRRIVPNYLRVASIDVSQAPYCDWLNKAEQIRYVVSNLIHADVNPHNLVHGHQETHLIDWEYAALGDPAFDLAGVIALWQLDTFASRQFLDAYGATAALAERTTATAWLFHMREMSWAAAMLRLLEHQSRAPVAIETRQAIKDQLDHEQSWLHQHFNVS